MGLPRLKNERVRTTTFNLKDVSFREPKAKRRSGPLLVQAKEVKYFTVVGDSSYALRLANQSIEKTDLVSRPNGLKDVLAFLFVIVLAVLMFSSC